MVLTGNDNFEIKWTGVTLDVDALNIKSKQHNLMAINALNIKIFALNSPSGYIPGDSASNYLLCLVGFLFLLRFLKAPLLSYCFKVYINDIVRILNPPVRLSADDTSLYIVIENP